MERLTKKNDYNRMGGYIVTTETVARMWSVNGTIQGGDHIDRLAAIEDILGNDYDLDRLSVMMNQCMSMRDEVQARFRITANIPIDRLKELVEADRDGRCLVLQKEGTLKKGDKIWYVDRENGEIEGGTVFLASYKEGKLDSFSVDFDCGDFDEFLGEALGSCFFSCKESAERALEGEREND